MRSKEDHYHSVLKNRGILQDPNALNCPCQNTLCEWHGRCAECVAIHRYNGEHLPSCLLPMLREQVRQLALVAEMEIAPEEPLPLEYQLYIRTRDKLKTKK